MTVMAEPDLYTVPVPDGITDHCTLLLPSDAPQDQWKMVRRGGLGASDLSTVLGLNPYADLHSLWMDKVFGVDVVPNDRMLLGQALEPFIRGKFIRDQGIDVETCGILQSRSKPFLRYTPDGITEDGGLFEAKSTAWWMADQWDDGQVADHAEIQVQGGMFVTGLRHAWVAALIDGNPDKFEVRRVERDERFIAAMLDAAELFWTEYVLANVEPPLTHASLEWAKDKWSPRESKTVNIGEVGLALFRKYKAAKQAEQAAKRVADDCEAQLRELVKDAHKVMVGNRHLGNLTTVTQNRLNKGLLVEDGIDPTKYTKETAFSRFFWKKGAA